MPDLKTRLNLFGAGILFASAIGLISLVVIAISLNTVNDRAQSISDDVVEGVGSGADSLDSAADALSDAAVSVDTFDAGIESTNAALDDAAQAIATSKVVSANVETSFSDLGESLALAAALLRLSPAFTDVANAVGSASDSSYELSLLFAEYSPVLDSAGSNIEAIKLSLESSQAAMPEIQREIDSASSNLSRTSDSLDSAGSAIEELSDSSAIPRIAIFALVFLGTLIVLLAFGGFAALTAARRVS